MSMKSPITRRNALKLMTAASGALLGSAVLPEKWLKPVVESGVLPVHAQSSLPNITLSELFIQLNFSEGESAQAVLPAHMASFTYSDPAGLFDDSYNLNASLPLCSELLSGSGETLQTWNAVITGTPYAGTVEFPFFYDFYAEGACRTETWTSTLAVSTSNGSRVSNQLEAEFEIPS